MMNNAAHIRAAIQSLGYSVERFKQLSAKDAEQVYDAALHHFVVGEKNPRWWWEYFARGASVQFVDGQGWQRILQIVPDAEEKVWFIAEDSVSPYSIWDASVRDIHAVIAECPLFEFYIIQKQFDWLLCENHHDVLFAVGDQVEKKLKELSPAH